MASNRQHASRRPFSAGSHGFGTARTLVLGLSRVLFSATTASAAPVPVLGSLAKRAGLVSVFGHGGSEEPEGEASMMALLIASAVLVLLGGAFAGLTIALMGQDSIYLQVLSRDDTDPQQKNAKRVHKLLQRGKHWVLVTLLLSNVIVNETLPVVLDRCLGGGVAAVVGSTVLIVIFGEVVPQSVCVRYGLQIGGFMANPVLVMMWIMSPVAWPTAKLLDYALGEDHGTVYKKSGLKTLVTLHRSLGEVSERLNQDEVTIISAVLDLKEKPVSSVMTPMDDVFTMSEDTVLDAKTIDMIQTAGYSRIPIHEPFNPTNFVGMLLVKILLAYDPEDQMRVGEFPLATLPETRPETSCLDIVNFFQEGKSHMVLVSQYPGEDHGALGVVTLEDVIEELIGEEIIDESDVYIDVHKAIRRLQPAPRARPMRTFSTERDATSSSTVTNVPDVEDEVAAAAAAASAKADGAAAAANPKFSTTVMMRRCSTGADGRKVESTVPVRANIDEMWQHLRHLGPSNRANNPKETRSTTVKIKQGMSHAAHLTGYDPLANPSGADISSAVVDADDDDLDADEGTSLLPKAADEPSFVQQVQPAALTYGTRSYIVAQESDVSQHDIIQAAINDMDASAPAPAASGSNAPSGGSIASRSSTAGRPLSTISTNANPSSASFGDVANHSSSDNSPSNPGALATALAAGLGTPSRRAIVRSGSITENVVETRGIRKVVLETSSSADDDDDTAAVVVSTSAMQHRGFLSGLRSGGQSGSHSPSAAGGATDASASQAAGLEDAVRAAQATAPGLSSGVTSPFDGQDGDDGDDAQPEHAASSTANASAAKKKNRRKKRKGGK